MEYRVLIGDTELSDFTIIPITDQKTLDESLDQGYVKLAYTDTVEAYKPFTNIQINVKDEFEHTKELYYFIASDNKTEIIANGTYNHELLLIEQSKWLERFLTGTKTVTHPLIHDYAGTQRDLYVVRTNWESGNPYITYYSDDRYKTLVSAEEDFTIPSANTFVGTAPYSSYRFRFTVKKGGIQIYTSTQTSASYTIQGGTGGDYYDVSYYYERTSGGSSTQEIEYAYQIATLLQFEEKPNKTITQAVNELLATIETLRESETPRFVFNSEQATKYSTVDAPEFTLTGTLWEALKQIGGYIHAIPRLRGNTIYFDELGGNEKVSEELSNYTSSTERFDIEQYASSIDSTVQNFVNLESVEEGAIIEPYDKGYKTPRTDTGTVQITEENMFIQTKEPIEQIVKVEMGFLNDGTYVGDITPYIYEAAEYDTLSSYENVYPYSKAYALKYTIGQKNITELNFKVANPIHEVFTQPAILNIVSRTVGKNYNLFSTENMFKLQFRVTYIPMTAARVKQYKPNKKDAKFPSALSYNQSAQKVSSRAYGEAMKGAIARLGNLEVSKVYILNDLTKIPEVGQLFDDDYYISVVKCEYYKDFVRCELGLSKDFNKLNEYVGIKSEIRFYEISEKQATQRFINYEDFCIVGDEEPTYEGSLITSEGVQKFANSFSSTATKDTIPVNVVKAKGDNNTEVALAVTSYAVGNSNVFTFHYDDNYSAGETVTQNSGTTIQNQVRYTDVYGEIETLEIDFGKITDTINNYNTAVTKGNSVPRTTNISNFTSWFSTNGDKIVIKKDNREIPVFTYQINYVTNRDKMIIGSGLARYCTFATSKTQDFKLYVLNEEIPKFAKTINILNATEQSGLATQTKLDGFKITNVTANTNGKAWAICQGDEIVIAENIEIKSGTEIVLPHFAFARSVQDRTVQEVSYTTEVTANVIPLTTIPDPIPTESETIFDYTGMKPCQTIDIDGVETKLYTKKWKMTLYWEDVNNNTYEYETELENGVDYINNGQEDIDLLGNGIMFAIDNNNVISKEHTENTVDYIYIDCQEYNKLKLVYPTRINIGIGVWLNSHFTGIKIDNIIQTEYKI